MTIKFVKKPVVMLATIGDWIIKGVNGEFYPCKPDIFEKTYEVAEEQKAMRTKRRDFKEADRKTCEKVLDLMWERKICLVELFIYLRLFHSLLAMSNLETFIKTLKKHVK